MTNTPTPVKDTSFFDKEIADKVQLVAHIRKSPLLLYGIFVELARQLYSSERNIPIDVSYIWDEDPAESTMWIDTEYRWEDENPEFRPAIYVKLSELTYKSITGRHDSLSGIDLEQGEYHYSRDGMGSASFVHVGRSEGESVILAGSTLDFVDAFSRVIRDDFCFKTFEVISLQPLQLDKESKERYRSTVTVSFSFEDTWAIKLESQKLKRLVFRARQALVEHGIL